MAGRSQRQRDVCLGEKAGEYEIPYAKGLSQSHFSMRWAEQEFLDQYYQPKIGRQLNRLPTEEPI